MALISSSPEWKSLDRASAAFRDAHLRDMFAGDPKRAEKMRSSACGLYLDYSKNKADAATLALLFDLARAAGVEEARAAMFAGAPINETEGREVLHIALRARDDADIRAGGRNVVPDVVAEREKMRAFVGETHSGARTGRTGKKLDTVVNIGIGGSDLGPAMAARALRAYAVEGRRAHFVSNVDGADLAQTLEACDPERTLFLIASKTFTTMETMTNAASARAWFLENGGAEADIAKHFAALSTNDAAVREFGIGADAVFRFWDWVGGRYSLWSAIGLSLALYVGYENFEKLLAGGRAMDEHFRDAPLERNMPALMALIGVWNRNFLGFGAHAVIPYDEGLARFPAYLQQADMESNGKRAALSGEIVDYGTGPIIFGEPGTNAQHSFFQLLHQGTDVVPVDFILPCRSHYAVADHHDKMMANCLAQAEALMIGETEAAARAELAAAGLDADEIDRLAPHKTFPGDRPSNMILMEKLTPETLGALIALYEHKIFVQGRIWGVNSFDQWGVELGKTLAKRILPELAGETGQHDASTSALIARVKRWRDEGR